MMVEEEAFLKELKREGHIVYWSAVRSEHSTVKRRWVQEYYASTDESQSGGTGEYVQKVPALAVAL
jgi:hypothetical protein